MNKSKSKRGKVCARRLIIMALLMLSACGGGAVSTGDSPQGDNPVVPDEGVAVTEEAPLPEDLGEVYEENKEKVDREVLEELAKGEAEKTEATNESEPIQSGGAGVTPSDTTQGPGGAEEPVRVEVLVSLASPAVSSDASLNEVQEATALIQGEVMRTLNAEDFLLKYQYENFPALAGSITREGLDALLSNPQVTYIEANRILELHLGESVPLIGADQAQNNLGVTGKGVTVGIIDTGIDYNHPDLGGCLGPACKVQGGRDFVDGDNNPMDGHGHGTHVAGIVAANGTVRGVAPDARLVALRVCSAEGCPTDRMIAAIDWARTHQSTFNIRALNMSIGGSVAYNSACNGVSPLMTTAIRNARQSGIVTFVSSGNNGFSKGISFPACVSDAVSVGAVYDANWGSVTWSTAACTDAATVADLVACGSNSGAILDLLAPGAYIRSTQWGGGYVNWKGTSMASPHAAGTATLLLEANGALTPNQVQDILIGTGANVLDAKSGVTTPRIDALAAVESILTVAPPPPPPPEEEVPVAAVLNLITSLLLDE